MIKNNWVIIWTVITLFTLIVLFFIFTIKVPAWYAWISVDLYANDVEPEWLPVGRSVINPITHDYFLYPVHIQQKEYEFLNFQDEDWLVITADIWVDYKFDDTKIGTLYKEYRSSAYKITNEYMKTWLKDSVNRASSKYKVDVLYWAKKEEFRQAILTNLQTDFGKKGIIVNNVYFVNEMELPNEVRTRINAKIEATQKAMQIENELRATEAEAQKKIAEAKGIAESAVEKAKWLAEAKLIEAEAIAKANKMINQSVSQNLINYNTVETWNGELPQVTWGSIPMINLK